MPKIYAVIAVALLSSFVVAADREYVEIRRAYWALAAEDLRNGGGDTGQRSENTQSSPSSSPTRVKPFQLFEGLFVNLSPAHMVAQVCFYLSYVRSEVL